MSDRTVGLKVYMTFADQLGLLVVEHLKISPPEQIIKALQDQIATIVKAYEIEGDDDVDA